ncbi:DUF6188 family protein [Streptomyces sp. RKAG290]|uniref:DUF6188 family protein n=1 Tax=Streptomyces sp. RKAG290 TaxID=2888348 RepID=UPI0020333C95|nr:DUF6188 family protein [Streptomyces sp. RKAG290]MCM2412048.1 DUF6188 family protein [Streptomyces sp. RKAG290]
MSEPSIDSSADRWVLRGLRSVPVLAVSGATDGSRLDLTLDGGTLLTVVGPVRITHGPATAPEPVVLPAEEVGVLKGATVLSAVAFRSGSLRLVFSTGHHLTVRGADPGVRAELCRPGEFTWVSQQGVGRLTEPGIDSA